MPADNAAELRDKLKTLNDQRLAMMIAVMGVVYKKIKAELGEN